MVALKKKQFWTIFRDLEKDGLWGKADPYVLVTLGDQKAKSGTVGNTQVYFIIWTASLKYFSEPNLELHCKSDGGWNHSTKSPSGSVWRWLGEGGYWNQRFLNDFLQDDLLGKTFIDVRNIAERKQLFDQWTPLQVEPWVKGICSHSRTKPPWQGCKSGEVLLAATFRPLGSQTLMETPVTVEQVGRDKTLSLRWTRWTRCSMLYPSLAGDPSARSTRPVLWLWLWLLWWWGSRHQDPQQQDDRLHGQGFQNANIFFSGDTFSQVRLLQQAKQAFAGGLPEMEDRSDDIAALKHRWDDECNKVEQREMRHPGTKENWQTGRRNTQLLWEMRRTPRRELDILGEISFF